MPFAYFASVTQTKTGGGGGGGATGTTATISPAVNGQTTIDLAAGLNLGSSGQWTLTPSANITADVEMWGAGGAGGPSGIDYRTSMNSIINSTTANWRDVHPSNAGGGGGYTYGRVVLSANTTYTIQVGQGGIRVTGPTPGATYLRGGTANKASGLTGGTQGGGYSGLFRTATITQGNALLVAGGGGGGGGTTAAGYEAGAGGGSSGQGSALTGTNASPNQGGGGGTQATGGVRGIGSTSGSALTGGLGTTGTGAWGQGGGGGYFGGGGGNIAGGGGGSGFFSSNTAFVLVSPAAFTVTGSRATPGFATGANRAGAGQGATGPGSATAPATAPGADGRVIIKAV